MRQIGRVVQSQLRQKPFGRTISVISVIGARRPTTLFSGAGTAQEEKFERPHGTSSGQCHLLPLAQTDPIARPIGSTHQGCQERLCARGSGRRSEEIPRIAGRSRFDGLGRGRRPVRGGRRASVFASPVRHEIQRELAVSRENHLGLMASPADPGKPRGQPQRRGA
jgi:hypothetical protein